MADLRDCDGENNKISEHDALVARRRRVLKMGIGVAPVALTLTSRPILATQTTTASAFTSLAVASRSTRTVTSNGCSPSTWCNTATTSWPSNCREYVNNTWVTLKCSSVWYAGCLSGISGTDPTTNTVVNCGDSTRLKTLMRLTGGGDKLLLAQACAAAHVNAAGGLVNGIHTTAQVKNMFTCTRDLLGWYEPTAGIKWTHNCTTPSTAQPPTALCGGVRGYLYSTWA